MHSLFFLGRLVNATYHYRYLRGSPHSAETVEVMWWVGNPVKQNPPISSSTSCFILVNGSLTMIRCLDTEYTRHSVEPVANICTRVAISVPEAVLKNQSMMIPYVGHDITRCCTTTLWLVLVVPGQQVNLSWQVCICDSKFLFLSFQRCSFRAGVYASFLPSS